MKYLCDSALIKILLTASSVFLISSCTVKEVKRSHLVTIDGRTMLVGLIDQEELFREFPVFKENYEFCQPHDSTLQFIRSFSKNISVQIYLGTWCSDTQEHIPVFLKIFDLSRNPNIRLFLRGVDRTKIDPEKTAVAYDIKRVPTLIFLHQDKEFARFIESPELSVDEDLIQLLKKCP